jgi:hypothetical protein
MIVPMSSSRADRLDAPIASRDASTRLTLRHTNPPFGAAARAQHLSPIEVRPRGERSFYRSDPDAHRVRFVDETTRFLGRGAAWE